jgi:hypothetical protein
MGTWPICNLATMGASCTRLDISPTVAANLSRNSKPIIQITNCRFETVWKALSPYFNNAVERGKMRRLLCTYLQENPCRDRYLVLIVNGDRWVFEIATHRRSPEYTEVVIGSKARGI